MDIRFSHPTKKAYGDLLSGLEWVNVAPMKGKNGIIATWEHEGIEKKSFDPAVKFDFDTGFNARTIQPQV